MNTSANEKNSSTSNTAVQLQKNARLGWGVFFACVLLVLVAAMSWQWGKRVLQSLFPPEPVVIDESMWVNAFIVPAGASQVSRSAGVSRSQFVGYTINEAYPASQTLAEISKTLEQRGWHPLEEDWLNPGTPSSHVRGWTEFEDATGPVLITVHQWMAQWRDDAGHLVDYTLRYSYATNGPPNKQMLYVSGMWFPSDEVKKRMAEVR